MLIVAALGGNALVRRGEDADPEAQRRNLATAAAALAPLARDHSLVITHGNGPQIGMLALSNERDGSSQRQPLDVLGAESEGMIGYLIEQDIANRLPGRDVATLLTRVAVDASDPAFATPTKPIGPIYSEADARRHAAERGWQIAPDGLHFRRVVPSPEPLCILELRTIRLLVEHGVIVVCAGGGGIPVTIDATGAAHGIEAVIDKDFAASLLARDLAADMLLLLTDVPAVYEDWPKPAERPIRTTTVGELRQRRFAAGSMAPKVEAACRFVEATGRVAAIGALGDAARLLRRDAGTIVVPDRQR